MQANALILAVAAVAVLLALWLWRGAAARAQQAAAGQRMAEERLATLREGMAGAEGRARLLEERLAEVSSAREAQALRAGQAETRIDALESRLHERGAERDRLEAGLRDAQAEVHGLKQQLAQVTLAARKDAEAAARELATLRELRKEMTEQFRLLADESLRATGTDLQTRHAEQLSALLTPFREQVATFRTEMQTREEQANTERARLGEQIRLLHARSEQIGADAVALTRALKGDKQKQGAWGEMILARLLEDSGLEAGTHYLAQDSRRDEDGRLWRPDVILRLPQQKVLVVDSKVSLNAYVEATDAEDAALREAALKRHVQAMRNHVQTLSDKGYARLDQGSVDYVMMFVPIEGAYAEAVRADSGLVGWALQKRVAVMTPATLMLALRIVDHIWTVERRESNAAEIASRAGALYDKLALFVTAMDEVGTALGRATKAHDQAMDRLTRGQGNVIRQVEMLRGLGARASKQIGLDHDREDERALQ